jgi:hypothetical protein
VLGKRDFTAEIAECAEKRKIGIFLGVLCDLGG